jgi:hypothetical protein
LKVIWMAVHEGVLPPQNAVCLPDLAFFYKFFVSVNVFSLSK